MRYRLIIFIICISFNPTCFSAQSVFEAARKGDVRQLEKLLSIKRDTINSKDNNGFTPLIIACYRGQAESAQFLLKNGANVNENSPEGPALMASVYKSDTSMTLLLLLNGSDPNITNEEGITPLMYATINNHVPLVKLLIRNGANTNAKSNAGWTALTYAREYELKDLIEILSK